VSTVWVRGQGDVLIRADFIVGLVSVHGTLNAECANGRTVCLADSDRADALQLALLDEIGRVRADDRLAVVITPPAGLDLATWRCDYAHTAGPSDRGRRQVNQPSVGVGGRPCRSSRFYGQCSIVSADSAWVASSLALVLGALRLCDCL
jgi:hypothetical protein